MTRDRWAKLFYWLSVIHWVLATVAAALQDWSPAAFFMASAVFYFLVGQLNMRIYREQKEAKERA
jgi:hypothetical protein